MNLILTKTYTPPPFNKREIFRYAGCNEPTEEIKALAEECISECENALSYKVCYTELPVKITGDEIDFSFMTVKSKALAKNLSDCNSAVIFGATIGLELDRLIAKYGRISPSKALIFQAIGAERIESLCDTFNSEFNFTRPRFSPGYGDFPLDAQRDIFRILDCPRKIGLSLNESLLMSPSKSVTAIIGLSDCNREHNTNKCTQCNKKDCSFRSTNK